MRGPPGERSDAALCRFGVVNLDKPPGPSAHEVAGWVRDAVNDALTSGDLGGAASESPDGSSPAGIDGAAHGGTLDPKVTGCLPMLLGDATRLAQVLHRGVKEYVAVLELHARPPADLEAVVAEFEGKLYQTPPRKSAVVRERRIREVYDLDILEVADRQVLLRIRCEGGTYVRKLCHDLGLALGTGAHMGDLRRTATTPFDDRDLHSLEELVDALAFARGEEEEEWATAMGESTAGEDHELEPPIDLRDVVQPAERALEHLPAVTIAPSAAESVATGAPVYGPGVIEGPTPEELADRTDSPGVQEEDAPPLVACYTPDDAVVCLGRLVGDPAADAGVVVDLERVLVSE